MGYEGNNTGVMWHALHDICEDEEFKYVIPFLYNRECRQLNKELGIKNINYGKNTHKEQPES